jgi:hypothetical protein
MTTTTWNTYVPGLVKAYGPNQKLGVRAIPMRGGDIDVSSTGEIEFHGDVHMQLMI